MPMPGETVPYKPYTSAFAEAIDLIRMAAANLRRENELAPSPQWIDNRAAIAAELDRIAAEAEPAEATRE